MEFVVFRNNLPVSGPLVSVTFKSKLGEPLQVVTGEAAGGLPQPSIVVRCTPTRAGDETIQYFATVSIARGGRVVRTISSAEVKGQFAVESWLLAATLEYTVEYVDAATGEVLRGDGNGEIEISQVGMVEVMLP